MRDRYRFLKRAASLIGFTAIIVASPLKAQDADEQGLAKGRDVYLNKCAKCHKFRDPKNYTDAKWEGWMEKMEKKAHLDDEQYQALLQYTDYLRKK